MKNLMFVLILASIVSCSSLMQDMGMSGGKDQMVDVIIPFLRNSSNECYYLDEFMPAPDSMVSGESDGMKLRYYTYLRAQYKTWKSYTILLSFYSLDRKCWSLFEEAYQKIEN